MKKVTHRTVHFELFDTFCFVSLHDDEKKNLKINVTARVSYVSHTC